MVELAKQRAGAAGAAGAALDGARLIADFRAAFKQTRVCAGCGAASPAEGGGGGGGGGLHYCGEECRGAWAARRTSALALTPAQLTQRVAQAYIQVGKCTFSWTFLKPASLAGPDEHECCPALPYTT